MPRLCQYEQLIVGIQLCLLRRQWPALPRLHLSSVSPVDSASFCGCFSDRCGELKRRPGVRRSGGRRELPCQPRSALRLPADASVRHDREKGKDKAQYAISTAGITRCTNRATVPAASECSPSRKTAVVRHPQARR